MSFKEGSGGRAVRVDRSGNVEGTLNLPSTTTVSGNPIAQSSVNNLRIQGNTTNTAAATGGLSVAIAAGSTASADDSIAFGTNSSATSPGALAVGQTAQALGAFSTAIGRSSTANGQQGTALGNSAVTSGQDTAVGDQCIASGGRSSAYGIKATASGLDAVAVGGWNSVASGTRSIACGRESTATATDATAIGYLSSSTAIRSVCIGQNVTNSVADSFLFGTNANQIARFEAPTVITQTGSLTGGVTANTSCGIITAFSTYGVSGTGTFTVTCNRCTTDSVVLLSLSNAVTATPVVARACVGSTADGSFTISFQNPDGAAATVAAPKYHFQIFNPKNV